MMKTKNEAMNIAKLYNKWIDESERVKSPCTVRAFTITMNLYVEYLTRIQHINIRSFSFKKCFCRGMIEKWLRWLEGERKGAPQSCNVRLSNLRSFLRYLSVENYKYMDLYLASTNVEYRKTVETKISGISKDAVNALLKSIDTTTEVGLRDCILWQMVYLTGMRISEVLSVKLKDLNLKVIDPYVTIIGKRSKVRSPYLPKVLVDNLKVYILRVFGKEHDGNSFLFFSRVKGKNQQMTVKGAENRLKKNAAVAHKKCKDVPLDLRPHMLRHSFASHLIDDGANVIQVSELLGHKDISTTMRYLDVSFKQTESAMISIESETIRNISPKWEDDETLLPKLFKRNAK